MSESRDDHSGYDVAVIGMAGRFPGASTVAELWRNLCEGRESIRQFSEEELRTAGTAETWLKAPGYVRARGVLDGIEQFDAEFFDYSAAEAEQTGPQQRLFLEACWEALEVAGYDPARCEGRIGLFAGAPDDAYLAQRRRSRRAGTASARLLEAIGNESQFLTTQVSYRLGLTGPSVGIQTACSTSLVAVHLACQSVIHRECDMALAGGVSISLPQTAGYLHHEGDVTSPDGHCRAFDARAAGSVPGNGLGVVLLKRLSQALADGDHIHAVIRGSAINNDGAQKVGFTAPSVEGQAEAVAEALALAGFGPETVTYVQSHGTATALGDPVEIAALRLAFCVDKRGYCALGSVKTNLGHLNSAAGVAGLITAVLALEHERIPPSLHFERPNPEIGLDESPFYVNATLREWPRGDAKRRAAVSSFGIGGTNAHVVLEEAPAPTEAPPSSSWELIVLSARTSSALDSAAARLAVHLREHPLQRLADVAHTLRAGRRPFGERCGVVCRDVGEAVAALEGRAPERFIRGQVGKDEVRVVFMFPGQGAQYPGMGGELYRTQPVFRREVDRCLDLLEPLLGQSLRTVLYPETPAVAGQEGALSDTRLAQPALFTVEYALARLWQSWGVQPEALIGHSIGEYVAACLAGVFELEDALRLVALRGRLMQAQPTGAMLAVSHPLEQVVRRFTGSLALAAVNAASLCVVSGTEPEVDALEGQLVREGVACQRVKSSHAFHGPMMEEVVAPFEAAVSKTRRSRPRVPLMSNLTGTWMTPGQATDPEYWARHLRQPVLFADGCTELLADARRLFLEVGAGRFLQSLVRQAPGGAERLAVATLPRSGERESDGAVFLKGLGQLWIAGVPVDWSGADSQGHRRVPLPTYPFERQRYWLEPGLEPVESTAPVESADPDDWFYVPTWRRSIPIEHLPRGPEAGASGSWLVFRDSVGLADEIARNLKERGCAVITATAADRFERGADGCFTMRPRQREDYAALLADLARHGTTLQGIAHAWALQPAGPNDEAFDPQAESQALGLFSLLFLAQAIGEAGRLHPLRLEVVTTGLFNVTGQETLCPSRATVLGPCRVIPQEYSGITCRVYDVVHGSNGRELSQLAERLAAEFAAEPHNGVVAYRHGHRWMPSFDRLARNNGGHGTALVEEGGVYLITGGLEDPGLAVAEYLAARGARGLVLVSQPELPSAGSPGRPGAGVERAADKVAERIAALEAQGVRLALEAVDVADLEAMERIVARAEERFGPIRGAVHAARAPSEGLMQFKTAQAVASVLATKARGAWVLQRVLEARSARFLVLFGSSTGITGVVGQVDDCAANAFLDSFACAQATRGCAGTLVLDWPPWRHEPEGQRPLETSRLVALVRDFEERIGITVAEGLAVLDRALRANLPDIVVSRHDFEVVVAGQSRFTAAHLLDQLRGEGREGTRRRRPARAGEYVPPSSETEAAVAAVWEELFGFAPIGTSDDFFELGGHSLLAIEMISRLRESLGAEIPLGLIFDASRLANLARVLAADAPDGPERERLEELLREVETLSPEEAARFLRAEEGVDLETS